MTPLNVLTVDDHPVVLSGLRLLFSADPRFTLCGEAASPAEACARASALQPDLIVTDLVLGGADGVALIVALRALVPAVQVVVYSSHDELLWARHVLHAGARGYVSKARPLDEVAVALETVVRGGIHVSEAVQRLIDRSPAGPLCEPHDLAALSARELQILTLIGGGGSLPEMALALGLSVKTIGTYRERLKTKLGFDTARELDRFAALHVARTAPTR